MQLYKPHQHPETTFQEERERETVRKTLRQQNIQQTNRKTHQETYRKPIQVNQSVFPTWSEGVCRVVRMVRRRGKRSEVSTSVHHNRANGPFNWPPGTGQREKKHPFSSVNRTANSKTIPKINCIPPSNYIVNCSNPTYTHASWNYLY